MSASASDYWEESGLGGLSEEAFSGSEYSSGGFDGAKGSWGVFVRERALEGAQSACGVVNDGCLLFDSGNCSGHCEGDADV